MHSVLLAAALAATASAGNIKGFNYGSQGLSEQDYETQFKQANSLPGADGFNSARLYTMIEDGTDNTPISAIQAAVNTNTQLLLGLWASAGQDQFNQELTALKSAVDQFGDKLKDLVVGISVGSEDLYRDSEMGVKANAGIGADASTVVSYINQVKQLLSGTPLSGASIGHVDTWTAWVNGSNSDVINNVDWLGFDAYPYFQNTMPNSIDDAKSLLYQALDNTKGVSNGKPVWITETGWPVSGPQSNEATASVPNAQTYWDEVGCELFDNTNIFWYILEDQGASPSFGILGADGKPLFDLSCSGQNKTDAVNSTSSAASSTAASTSSAVSNSTAAASSSAAATSAESSAEATSAAASAASSAKASTGAAESSAAPAQSSAAAGSAVGSAAGSAPASAAQTSAAQESAKGSSAAQTNGATAISLSAGALIGAVAVFLL